MELTLAHAILLLAFGNSVEFLSDRYNSLQSCESGFALPSSQTASLATRSLLDCLLQCSENASCLSVNVCPNAAGGENCQRFPTVAVACSLLQVSPGCRYIIKSCLHGVRAPGGGACICNEGYAGTACERLIRDCSEGLAMGMTGERAHQLIQPLGSPHPFPVYCYFGYGGLTIVLRRLQSCPDTLGLFQQPWDRLKYQLGDCNCHCFVGLENLYYILRQRRYTMKVFVRYSNWTQGGNLYYPNVTLGDESSRYALSFGSPYCPHASCIDDAMLPGGNRKFCSLDNDCSGCAASAGHAGWYNDSSGSPCLRARGFDSVLQWPAYGALQNLNIFSMELFV